MLCARLGLRLDQVTRLNVERAVKERCGRLKLSPAAYKERLTSDPQDGEWLLLESLCTNNETYFFREPETLHWLVNHCQSKDSVRLWCAGCSTGEEPYSLAILLEASGYTDYELLSSDVDIEAIRIALQRTYLCRRLRSMPEELKSELERHSTPDSGTFRLDPFPRVHFHRSNLLNPRFAESMGPFDAIVCRNLLIYLTDEAQKRVIDAFYNSLIPGGVLVLGVCESLISMKTSFLHQLWDGASVYVKEDLTDAPR